MTTRLTFPASMFSVVCQRCGSTMRKNADSCPTCGADRAEASGQKASARAAKTEARGAMFEQQSSAPLASASASMTTPNGGAGAQPEASTGWNLGFDPKRAGERIAQKAAEHRSKRMERVEQSARNAYAEPALDPDALPGSGNWNQRKTVIAAACAVLLAVGAVFYLQHGSDDDDSPSADHSVSGAIDSKLNALTGNSTGTPNAVTIPRPSAQAAQHPLSPGDPLISVRAALDQHDLVTAHARVKALSAQQQARPEFETLKEELVKRELQRDAALQLARACERTSAWACVQQNAGEALSIDGGNVESQAMLERVIGHAGWATGTNPALARQALAAPAVANAKQAAAQNTPTPPVAQTTQAAQTAQTPQSSQAADAAASAPANVAAAKSAAAQRSAERRAQRNAALAAARQAAADDARSDTDPSSRADKLARAQAATNALTAATTSPPAAPTTQAAAPQPQPQPQPQYLGQSQTPAQPAAPATAQRGAQYLESPSQSAPSVPMYSAPAQPAATPHAPQYLPPATSSASPIGNPQASVSHASAQRVPPVVTTSPRATQAQTPPAPRATQNIAATAPAVATPSTVPMTEADKTEALERAIKQYGWSGSNSMPKPAQ